MTERLLVESGNPSTLIVAFPVAGGAPGPKRGANLWHAVEVKPDRRTLVRVLCRRVKLEHILDDWALVNDSPVSCPSCAAALRRMAR